MKIEELKAKYDSQPIVDVEREVEESKALHQTAHEEMILALFYLERTARFKENPRYAKSSFAQYVKDRFGISWNAYLRARIVYVTLPGEARDFGPGLVGSVVARCGSGLASKVFSDIRAAQSKRKTELPRAEIEKIVSKHAERHNKMVQARRKALAPAKQAKRTEARPLTYTELESRYAALRKENDELRATLAQKEDQIEKLLATVESFRNEDARPVPARKCGTHAVHA